MTPPSANVLRRIRDSVAFWRALACTLTVGLASLLLLHRSPLGEEPLHPDAQTFLDVLVLMDEDNEEVAIAVAQHFGRASELPPAPRADRVEKIVERLGALDPETRRRYLAMFELISHRIDGDLGESEYEVIDHNEVDSPSGDVGG